MKCLVVYDSYFGNTQEIAAAVGAGLGAAAEQVVQAISSMETNMQGMEFLVVGSPTRGFRPSEATAHFLKSLAPDSLKGVRVAAFDTRMHLESIEKKSLRFIVKSGGYAAKHIAADLQKCGGQLALPSEGFLVTGEEGPLLEGELERAEAWGRALRG